MYILGIETSCDETSVAIVENGTKILSNIVSSSVSLHAKTGGIIPEIAARQQIKYIIPVLEKAIKDSKLKVEKIDAIGVTIGPGLIGSLLIGIETAKTLAFTWNKPIIPVNHLIGHIYANFITKNQKSEIRNPKINAMVEFPAIVLIVSGGHTDLLLMRNYNQFKWLGGTRDDAAGEAFDKIARLTGLPYPGGPSIERAAKDGNPKAFNFPRPMWDSDNLYFSFSGLKTAVLREVETIKELNNKIVFDLASSVQKAVVDVLVKKTLKAAEKYEVKSILLSGGVSANQSLRDEFKLKIASFVAKKENLKLKIKFYAPEKILCTDNAAMIASAAYFNYKPAPLQKIIAVPDLYF